MTNIQFTLMQNWQEYLLLGSLALLLVAIVAKVISMSARRETPPQPEPDADAPVSIGSYRNRVLTPNF